MLLHKEPMRSRALIRQIAFFGLVGIAATLTHVSVAWITFERLESPPPIANLFGAGAAFFVSFLGNALITFHSNKPVFHSATRYLVITLASYLLTSGIMALVVSRGWSGTVYAALVLAIVPPTSFILARFWVFAPARTKAGTMRRA